ncbi:MAG: non-ribosomal peptide synthetase [Planctomycetota bacterium]|jgi:amino acid adenylation domain-containing protein
MGKRLLEFSSDRRALLEQLLRERGTAAQPSLEIPRRAEKGQAELSFAQQRLWFLDQLVPGNPFYNIPLAIRYEIWLNIEAFERAIHELIQRHESLRTTFIANDGNPLQVIASRLTIPLPVYDLRGMPEHAREAEALRLASDEASKPFDLADGPLIRTSLIQMGSADFIFLLTLHHIIADGWSLDVFARELSSSYRALASGQPSPLEELPIQYADYAVWQRALMQGEMLEKQLAYWKEQLADLPLFELPADHPRPPIPSFRGDQHEVELPLPLVDRLKDLSVQSGTTLFMTLMAAFTAVLYRYTDQEDVVLGAPIAGRNRTELENLIGFFVNTLVLRIDHSGNPTFRQLLKRVREVTLGAIAHQELPFEKVVEELRPSHDLSRNPLCQVAFQLFNTPVANQGREANRTNTLLVKRGTSVFDLLLSLWEDGDGLAGRCEYSTDLFDAATIGRLLNHYKLVLEEVASNPDRRISELSLLTTAERRKLLIAWNDTERYFPQDTFIFSYVEQHAKRRPEALAVLFEGEQLTYEEVNRRANQLAHFLRQLDIGPESLVGLYFHRSPQMVVGILGVLKAGGAFLPLDPTYPRERLAFMLVDSRAEVLLTQESLADQLPDFAGRVVHLNADWKTISSCSIDNPESRLAPRNLAYVIYTSGSTGRPKGVQVEHQGMINVAQAQKESFGLDGEDRVLQFSSLSFDASVFEMMMAFYNGAALCLGTKESLLPGPALIQLLRENKVSIVTLPPSVLSHLPQEPLPDLHTITVAGEVCPGHLPVIWAQGRHFFNLYGPTEDTIWTTFATCTPQTDQKPPIGRPIANTRAYVLDSYLNPVPVGIPGELHIGGVGLARGYLDRPRLTAEKFIPNPFSSEPGVRMYRTGDLVRYLPDGSLEFLGRLDHQVKLRGFRIELGEIETALRQYPDVQDALVVMKDDVIGDQQLVGYVRADKDAAISLGDLRSHLRQQLPQYMVPSAFVILEEWPLTSNGKINRRGLPKPKSESHTERPSFAAPQTRLERMIAEVWQSLLPVEQVGLHDNFFDLGGHSLLLTRAHSKLVGLLAQDVSIVDLFQFPTVSSLAHYLSSDRIAPIRQQPIKDRTEKKHRAMRRRQERMRGRTRGRASDGSG